MANKSQEDYNQPTEKTDLIREASKFLDLRSSEFKGFPHQEAYDLLTGVGSSIGDREGDDRALWQKIDDEDLTDEEYHEATVILDRYPFYSLEDGFNDIREPQQKLVKLFDVEVNFDKFDVRMVKDLINRVNRGQVLSQSQFRHFKYFIYRYRDQLKDQIIYEENMSEELEELMGDDPREKFDELIGECKEAYMELNTRYEN